MPAARAYTEPIRPFGHPPLRPGAKLARDPVVERLDAGRGGDRADITAEPAD